MSIRQRVIFGLTSGLATLAFVAVALIYPPMKAHACGTNECAYGSGCYSIGACSQNCKGRVDNGQICYGDHWGNCGGC